MDTQLIIEYVELAKRLNVTETAKALNMSQPTLSKHISALEKSLRFPLFERSPNGFRLTRAGIDLLPFAYELVEKQDAFLSKAKTLRNNPLPRLTVGGVVNEESVTQALGRLISGMGTTYGTSFLELKSAQHKTMFEMLEERSVDIAFDFFESSDLADVEGIDCVLVSKIPLVALISKDNLLAQKKSITMSELAEYTLIKMEGAHMTNGWVGIEKACRSHGFEPNIRRQYSMKQMDLLTVSANLGNDVLILGANYVKRIYNGSSLFAKMIPIIDTDVYIPLSALFRMDNRNPILPEALDLISANGNDEFYNWKDEHAWMSQFLDAAGGM